MIYFTDLLFTKYLGAFRAQKPTRCNKVMIQPILFSMTIVIVKYLNNWLITYLKKKKKTYTRIYRGINLFALSPSCIVMYVFVSIFLLLIIRSHVFLYFTYRNIPKYNICNKGL